MTDQYRELYLLSKEDMEYRDRLVDELKHRTHQANAEIELYKENQITHPNTLSSGQVIIEVRVGNVREKVVITQTDMEGRFDRAIFFGMRDAVNRIMEALIRRGAQSL